MAFVGYTNNKNIMIMTKKIMFSDKYGLTDAVLNGNKTQTRRIGKDDIFSIYKTCRKTNSSLFSVDWM